jgi:hypothetical protein
VVTLNGMTNRYRHGALLATLFILYGAAHLVAATFLWLIVLGLAWAGYRQVLFAPETLALAGLTSAAVLPQLSAYSLLRGKRWAVWSVAATCAAVLAVGAAVVFHLVQTAAPRLSARRLTFILLYGAVSAALCLYGVWAVRRRDPI